MLYLIKLGKCKIPLESYEKCLCSACEAHAAAGTAVAATVSSGDESEQGRAFLESGTPKQVIQGTA